MINDSLGACAVSQVKVEIPSASRYGEWQQELSQLTGMEWAPALVQDGDESYHWNDSSKYLLYSFGVTLRDKTHDWAKRDIFARIDYQLTYDMDCHGNKRLTGYSTGSTTQTTDRGNYQGEYSNSRNFFERLWDAVKGAGGISVGYASQAGGNFSVGVGNRLAYTPSNTKISELTINSVGDLRTGKPLTFDQMQKLMLPMQDQQGEPVDYQFNHAEVVDNDDVERVASSLTNDDSAVIVMGIQEVPSQNGYKEATVLKSKDGRQIPITEPVSAVRSVQRQWVQSVGSSGYYTERGVFYVVEVPSTGEKVNISAREFSRLKQEGLIVDVTVQYR